MNAVIAYFMTIFSRFEDKAKGATAVEYGLMVALIAVAIIGGVAAIGTNLDGMFDSIAGKFTAIGSGE